MSPMPAVSLAAVPGRRRRTVEVAAEIERRGFSGIYGPSFGDVMSLCLSVGHATDTIPFGTAIQPIYLRRAAELAGAASYLAEVSGGRFRLGLGVSHAPTHARLGIGVGKPLTDIRRYVDDLRAAIGPKGAVPPIVLATLRTKMLRLAIEIADGAVWANAARSHMETSLQEVPADRRADGFFVGNMIPTVVDDDRAAAAAVNRRTLTRYVALPNYRNYWKEAGYVEEMESVEVGLADGDDQRVQRSMTDRWLSDVTLFGSAGEVREGVDAWFAAGVGTPILVPSATAGGQMRALEQLFAAYP